MQIIQTEIITKVMITEIVNNKLGTNYFCKEKNIEFFLRKARNVDAKIIFELSNEDVVRDNSINTNKIIWDDHLNWLSARLESKNCFYLLAFTKEDDFIGQIRYDIDNDTASISISISKDFRGKGFSTVLLTSSVELMFNQYSKVNFVLAKIHQKNIASTKTFTKAGYIHSHQEVINGNEFDVLELTRKDENPN